MKQLKINPNNLLKTRKLDIIPEYFETVDIDYKYNTIDAVDKWIYHNLSGRYAICKTVNICTEKTNRSYDQKVRIGFEKEKEASYFLLACPLLKYN
jgi:hypothetical protein